MQPTHVIAATAASELAKTTAVSQQMRLTASNARAVAARAGEQGKSFKAITPFVDELAAISVSRVAEVVAWAREFSQLASRYQQVLGANNAYQKAELLLAGKRSKQLQLAQEQAAKALFESKQAQEKKLAQMVEALEALQRQLRSGNVIATLSFVEAALMPLEQRGDLNSVGEMIVASVAQIRQHNTTALKLLRSMQGNL
ncbi:hypothetical protein [Salinibius halmophilus]|uniref:hypothetical protein n=1 Tax=Salinibius halmophilus TaxID=1853216 RepID=UPI001313F57A|nr:hypothetical protein [Salinibius halmophilus]